MQTTDIETCDFVFDRAKQVMPKSLQRFKNNIQTQPDQGLDEDVASWLVSQDVSTRTVVNDILRSFMMSKTTFAH